MSFQDKISHAYQMCLLCDKNTKKADLQNHETNTVEVYKTSKFLTKF